MNSSSEGFFPVMWQLLLFSHHTGPSAVLFTAITPDQLTYRHDRESFNKQVVTGADTQMGGMAEGQTHSLTQSHIQVQAHITQSVAYVLSNR